MHCGEYLCVQLRLTNTFILILQRADTPSRFPSPPLAVPSTSQAPSTSQTSSAAPSSSAASASSVHPSQISPPKSAVEQRVSDNLSSIILRHLKKYFNL